MRKFKLSSKLVQIQFIYFRYNKNFVEKINLKLLSSQKKLIGIEPFSF